MNRRAGFRMAAALASVLLAKRGIRLVWLYGFLVFAAVLVPVGRAEAVLINFDTDASGNALSAPCFFGATTRLTELYAPLGVHFSGPGGNDGGAILNECSNFGVNALSSPNFLAFNRSAPMSDGGIPQDPETKIGRASCRERV